MLASAHLDAIHSLDLQISRRTETARLGSDTFPKTSIASSTGLKVEGCSLTGIHNLPSRASGLLKKQPHEFSENSTFHAIRDTQEASIMSSTISSAGQKRSHPLLANLFLGLTKSRDMSLGTTRTSFHELHLTSEGVTSSHPKLRKTDTLASKNPNQDDSLDSIFEGSKKHQAIHKSLSRQR